MQFRVVGMCVTDKYEVLRLWFVRIEPQPQLGQKDTASDELGDEYGHWGGNLTGA